MRTYEFRVYTMAVACVYRDDLQPVIDIWQSLFVSKMYVNLGSGPIVVIDR